MKIELKGKIDSGNAASVEKSVLEQLSGHEGETVVLDFSALDYISSAGLRVILRLKKNCPDLRITDVGAEVYEILEMTGFTEIMPVEKAFRSVSIEGCEEIGRGANGRIYRLQHDTVVKVYKNADALEDIKHEREVAKLALILGIPTAISYDVVRVGDSYGSVFELLNAKSFSKILANEPEKMDWCVKEYVDMLKRIHATKVPPGKLPDMKETVLGWVRFMQDYLPEEAGKKLQSLVEAVPHDDHMIHGDYHTRNLELQNDEVLLIDMDTLAVGHPIFELGSIFNSFLGFSELNHEVIKKFQGFDYETGSLFWHKALAAYLDTSCEAKVREVENKARIIGYTRLIRRSIRRYGTEDAERVAERELWMKHLLELLGETDTLLFSRDELEIEAEVEKLPEVQAFAEERLAAADCPVKTLMQIDLAVEEIFVNIASYAYAPGRGKARMRVTLSDDPRAVTIVFSDRGVPYDPLARVDPDVKLTAAERDVGGLGVYMTKQIMDEMSYRFEDGANVLTLKKYL